MVKQQNSTASKQNSTGQHVHSNVSANIKINQNEELTPEQIM